MAIINFRSTSIGGEGERVRPSQVAGVEIYVYWRKMNLPKGVCVGEALFFTPLSYRNESCAAVAGEQLKIYILRVIIIGQFMW